MIKRRLHKVCWFVLISFEDQARTFETWFKRHRQIRYLLTRLNAVDAVLCRLGGMLGLSVHVSVRVGTSLAAAPLRTRKGLSMRSPPKIVSYKPSHKSSQERWLNDDMTSPACKFVKSTQDHAMLSHHTAVSGSRFGFILSLDSQSHLLLAAVIYGWDSARLTHLAFFHCQPTPCLYGIDTAAISC